MSGNVAANSERPYLIFTLGRRRAFAPGFSSGLATEIGARFLSVEGLQRELEGARRPGIDLQSLKLGQVLQLFSEQARKALGDGDDVLTDLTFNSLKTRQRIPQAIARVSRAAMVALYSTTPAAITQRRAASQPSNERWLDLHEGAWRDAIPRPPAAEGLTIIDADGSLDDPNQLIEQVAQRLCELRQGTGGS